MTDWRAVTELKQNPGKAREIATYLLTSPFAELNDWERTFVESAAKWHEVSSRRGEKLLEIRDGAVRLKSVEGFSAAALIKSCHDLRSELANVDDVEFVERLWALASTLPRYGDTALRRGEWRRLLRCARELGEIEPYQGHTFA